ncbi:hypothetical protein [Microtetraspora malaysiensis]|uniref:DUF4190 domain-containing protein n=1 Tax=Microtetraspora malaysiensis TaxID=161358 RepID=A0ABW6T1C0_9ACTN
MRATHALEMAAQVAAGLSLLGLWINFVLAGPIAMIGLVLAGIGVKGNVNRMSISYRWVAAVCLIVLVVVAIRWYLSTPVEYVVDRTARLGDAIPNPVNN